ncbi:MAG: hypothetical protein OHK0048_09630 [Rhodoferax sp.]
MVESEDGLLLGCDFSSTPSPRKPIVVALGQWHSDGLRLIAVERDATLALWEARLQAMPRWVGAFDFPFGLPRALVQAMGWPLDWAACQAHYANLTRADIRSRFRAFCQARPAGRKFVHRACDGPAGSSPSMKWVNPPVAWMMHAGVPVLRRLAAHFPGLGGAAQPAGTARIALEAYPGYLARGVLGRTPYKADDRARQSATHTLARRRLVDALTSGQNPLDLAVALTQKQQQALVDDPKGDMLDAVLALLQAAWAQRQHDLGHPHWGLPERVDPLEGWIVGVPAPA